VEVVLVAQLATFGSELNRPARDRVNENLTREIMLRVGELTGRQADQLLHQASAAARIGDTDLCFSEIAIGLIKGGCHTRRQPSPFTVLSALLASSLSLLRSHAALHLEIFALRHQLGVLQRSVKKPKLTPTDFFTVPTIRFQILYVFLVLAHERRRIVHFNVTDADNTVKGESWRRVRNHHFISQIAISENHTWL
jgi:hypothetical protein